GETRAATHAALRLLECVQPVVERLRRQTGIDAGGGVEEVRAFEAHRRRAVHRREEHLAEAFAQRRRRRAQVSLRRDVAAQAEPGAAHGCRLRSMITPTALAPRTAPGLLSFRRSCRTPNSSRMIAAQRSARVSTRPKLDSETNWISRLLTPCNPACPRWRRCRQD